MCNILIIDDNLKKINELIDVFEEKNRDEFDFNIFPKKTMSKEFSEKIISLAKPDKINDLYDFIKKKVEEYSIEVLILDFYLNGRDSAIPIDRTDGYSLLMKTRSGTDKFSKIPIYSYTWAQAELDKTKGLVVSGKLQGYISKSEDLKDDISERVLYNIDFESMKYNEIRETDIAVVCALNAELKAVLNLKLEWAKISIDEKLYYEGTLGEYNIIATSENKMGMPEAASLTTRVIDIFSPKYVVMTGIAAGVDPTEQNFLDLLIPERIFNWQSGKYKVKKISTNNENVNAENREDNNFIEKDFHIFEKDHRTANTYTEHVNAITLQENDFSKEVLKMLDFNSFEMRIPSNINIISEGMVSGSAVVADKDIVNDQIAERKIYGIDMEAYGVVFACNNHPREPKPIIIKAISDFADEDKNDDAQPAGMHVSAVAFQVLFEKFISSQP